MAGAHVIIPLQAGGERVAVSSFLVLASCGGCLIVSLWCHPGYE